MIIAATAAYSLGLFMTRTMNHILKNNFIFESITQPIIQQKFKLVELAFCEILCIWISGC